MPTLIICLLLPTPPSDRVGLEDRIHHLPTWAATCTTSARSGAGDHRSPWCTAQTHLLVLCLTGTMPAHTTTSYLTLHLHTVCQWLQEHTHCTFERTSPVLPALPPLLMTSFRQHTLHVPTIFFLQTRQGHLHTSAASCYHRAILG